MNGQMDVQQVLSVLSNLGIGGDQGGIGGIMQLVDFMKNNDLFKGKRRERRQRRGKINEDIVDTGDGKEVIDVEVKEEVKEENREEDREEDREEIDDSTNFSSLEDEEEQEKINRSMRSRRARRSSRLNNSRESNDNTWSNGSNRSRSSRGFKINKERRLGRNHKIIKRSMKRRNDD